MLSDLINICISSDKEKIWKPYPVIRKTLINSYRHLMKYLLIKIGKFPLRAHNTYIYVCMCSNISFLKKLDIGQNDKKNTICNIGHFYSCFLVPELFYNKSFQFIRVYIKG